VQQAFILGAGLGTRLRPLTRKLPKPLVPLFHQPLAGWAVEACERAGIHRFAVNTHHLPEHWQNFKNGHDLTLFHEPVLLETGGGLKNIEDWMQGNPLLIHNGDIFSTMPLDRLIEAHQQSGLPVTLALRSDGPARHIALDSTGSRVTDIRGMLGRSPGSHLFTGIYCVGPTFLDLIPAGEKVSVIPGFLELARQGKLGAVTLDEGHWLDLGDRDCYLQAHRELSLGPPVHPTAQISDDAHLERSVIGAGARIGSGAILRDCVVWPGCEVAEGAVLDRCIVYSGELAAGRRRSADL
jgi:mannose-1-phosphate guanylyltransferase